MDGTDSEWEPDTAELEELVDEVCGDAESTDEWLECVCEVAGGCSDLDDDAIVELAQEESDSEWEYDSEDFDSDDLDSEDWEALADVCGEPVDEDDEDWFDCFCEIVGCDESDDE